jgi:hypothetical protein
MAPPALAASLLALAAPLLALAAPLLALAFAMALSVTLATLLIPSATMGPSSMLFYRNVVSGVSGKGGCASAGATASGYAANHAAIRVGKMRVWRVCTAVYDGLQNLIGGGVNR